MDVTFSEHATSSFFKNLEMQTALKSFKSLKRTQSADAYAH